MTSRNIVHSDWDATIWFDGVGPFERRLEVTPAIAGWDDLSFRSYTFRAGQTLDGESASDEMTMVLLAGAITMEIDGPGGKHTWELSGRESMFDGPPSAIYLPPHHSYRTTIHQDADCCYGRAPAIGALTPRLFQPADLTTATEADGARVTHIFVAGDTEHLLCQETLIPPGQWRLPTQSTTAHQVSYVRTDPDTGWALLRRTDETTDEAALIHNGDAIFSRSGPHALVAAPGTRLYVLTYQVAG